MCHIILPGNTHVEQMPTYFNDEVHDLLLIYACTWRSVTPLTHTEPRALVNYVNHLRSIALRKLTILDAFGITPSDIAAMIVGVLGQNGTLEELEIDSSSIKVSSNCNCTLCTILMYLYA